ncbi:MAG: phage portal protein, partial [Chloroflexota bacterium]
MALYRGVTNGWNTAVSTYHAQDHVAEIEYEFTEYDTRVARYWHNRRYADNTIYDSLVNSYANTYKKQESLYKYIRGLRNPVGRLVQMEASKVFGGVIDYQDFQTGAIMLKGVDDTLTDAIRSVLQWSNFQTLKTLWVREGATMGDVALKIIDDTQRGKVRMEILDPRKIADVQFDDVGNVKKIIIAYQDYDFEGKRWYDYMEVMTKEMIQTYKDGDLFAYTTNVNGQPIAEWDNPYGFVPVQFTPHVHTALGFGVTSFHHVRHKIDNMNDLATLIHDNVRKIVNAKFAITGAKPSTDSSGKPETVSV